METFTIDMDDFKKTFTIDMDDFKKTVTATATGGNVNLSLDIDGNTTQDDTPTPDSPQEVNNITGDIVVSDGTNSVTIPLSTEELCSIGDYTDTLNIDLESGVVSKTGNIGNVVLDGSENYNAAANRNSLRYFYKNFADRDKTDNVISTRFPHTNSWNATTNINAINGSTNNQAINIMLEDTSIDTADQMKEYMSSYNTTVYYVLATPTTSTITTLSSSDLTTLKNILNGETITVTANLDTDYTINQSFQVRDFEVTIS